MVKYELYFSTYKLREYEKHLALAELGMMLPHLTNKTITDTKVTLFSESYLDHEQLKKLTFFSKIKYKDNVSTEKWFVPTQVILENLKGLTEKEIESGLIYQMNPLGKKREIRYLTHSFHEYKGRFYPQLARSFLNSADIHPTNTVLDPFCGSGTTLVESLLFGVNAIGIDTNPIAFLIAKSKVRSLFIPISELISTKQHFERVYKLYDGTAIHNLESEFDGLDIDYLRNWFPETNLKVILFLLYEINNQSSDDIQLLLKVTLSNLLRDYSFQDTAQLRIRRRKDEPPTNIFETYLSVLNEHINILQKYHKFHIQEKKILEIENYIGDSRKLSEYPYLGKNSVDCIITSPPYATALPYVDTDRLSLFVLGYTNRRTFRILEQNMIGNREITKKDRQMLDQELERNFTKSILPNKVIGTIEKIYRLNKRGNVGFRRKNTAALLFKYFIDMQQSLTEMNYVLKPGKYNYMVVGGNKTTAGDEQIIISTDDFIGLIAENTGFELSKKINMTVPNSHMIHSKNAISQESILVLKKS